MELIKKNIHMDRIKYNAFSQIALEDDINIPDAKADVKGVNFEKGKVQIEEVRVSENNVLVKGALIYSILYQSSDDAARLVVLEGKLTFEEKVHMEGVSEIDAVNVHTELEDLTVSMINSRKLSVQTLVGMNLYVEELYDEDTTIDIYPEDGLEYCKRKIDIAQIAIQKNDIFRIKDEIEIPKNYPNLVEVLWDSISFGEFDFRVLDEKIQVQGEVNLFILYEGEGEEHPIRSFENTIPISGSLECHGSKESMVGDLEYIISQKELDIRPDFDGEERALGIEIVLDIGIKLYEEEEMEIISDIYGVNHEIVTQNKMVEYRKLLMKNIAKNKINEKIKIKNEGASILQLLHSQGKVIIDEERVEKDCIIIQGAIALQVMYITNDDNMPYKVTKGNIPFSYTMEANDIQKEDYFKIQAYVEQLHVTMLDSEEMDVKAILYFKTVIFQGVEQNIITEMEITDVEHKKIRDLPGMIIYLVKEGDNLWNIGKKYYVSVESIKRMNNLTSHEISEGDKLFIARGN